MKHKKFGFLHLMCGKQGGKGNRTLSVEIDYRNAENSYWLLFTMRLVIFFIGFAIKIKKKQEVGLNAGESVSQETAENGSVQ